MKREIKTPEVKENSLQAIITYLISNGMGAIGAEQFIHINIPALGEYKSIVDCAQEDNWTMAWYAAEAYMRGDFF